jgi:sugar phosphate isomerase/epimerase
MEILYFYPRWGSENLSWEAFFQNAAEDGFDGVEICVPVENDEKQLVRRLLVKTGLKLIAQQWLTLEENDFEKYKIKFEACIRNSVDLKPLFINSQTGRDYFSFEQNGEIIDLATRLEKELDIAIVHETHRGKMAYSPGITQQYFDRYPELKITADFSHWCNVTESYLQNFSQEVEETMSRSVHIHARVGHPEGPQVINPKAPEWEEALNFHLNWWDQIVELHSTSGNQFLTITPEFGPKPYMTTIPFLNNEIADQKELNIWMRNLLKERYN